MAVPLDGDLNGADGRGKTVMYCAAFKYLPTSRGVPRRAGPDRADLLGGPRGVEPPELARVAPARHSSRLCPSAELSRTTRLPPPPSA